MAALADNKLRNFPVLIRLRDELGGFTYNQVKSLKGGDLRFLDTAGNELPYSIDVWNTDGESDIWVSVPELSLNGGTKFTMYWGNPDATAVPPTQLMARHGRILLLSPTLTRQPHVNDVSPQGHLGSGAVMSTNLQ